MVVVYSILLMLVAIKMKHLASIWLSNSADFFHAGLIVLFLFMVVCAILYSRYLCQILHILFCNAVIMFLCCLLALNSSTLSA